MEKMELSEYETLSKYGVTLHLLTHDKIELLRTWRNHPKIQKRMEFREEITPEMQEKWFKKISTSGRDFYYIIEYQGKEIGCINIRDVDFEKGEGEPGIFIWDDDYLGTDVPTRASFCMGDFVWDVLKLKREVIHVLKDNKQAILYNKQKGFKLSPNQEDVYNQEYTLTAEDAAKKSKRIKAFLLKENNL